MRRAKTEMGNYPGQGCKMSSYGIKLYNPQEFESQWIESCKVKFTYKTVFSVKDRQFFRRLLSNFSARKQSVKTIL